jgi:hypothetical protein
MSRPRLISGIMSECIDCAQDAEIVARGRCNRCYQRWYQGQDSFLASRMKRDQQKARKALLQIIDSLETLKDSGYIRPELLPLIRSEITSQINRVTAELDAESTQEVQRLEPETTELDEALSQVVAPAPEVIEVNKDK